MQYRGQLQSDYPLLSRLNRVLCKTAARLPTIDSCDAPLTCLAQGRGKMLHAPFAGKAVSKAPLSVPALLRYIKGLRSKHVLKSLLGRRLPGYPIDTLKGGGGLPLERFVLSGPLHRFLQRYSVPDFLANYDVDRLFQEPNWFTWNVITYAIWYKRVVRNPAVSPTPGVQVWGW